MEATQPTPTIMLKEKRTRVPAEAAERDYRRVVNAWAMYEWANSARLPSSS